MEIADEYFNNSRRIITIKKYLNKKVRYNYFAREDGIVVGVNKAVNYISENTYGDLKITGFPDGQLFRSKEPVLIVEGSSEELITLETTILGFLSFSGCAQSMNEIVQAANGTPVIDMSARHFPWQIIEEVSLAAYLGGASGTSTKAGWKYVQKWYNPGEKFKLYASLPHAIAALEAEFYEITFPSVAAILDFCEVFPEKPITLLADYEGQELDVVKQAFTMFGDKLFAVRLDTHGDRQMQGTSNQKNPDSDKYYYGRGVTIESVFVMRKFLDEIGAKNTKIIVSSGFTKEKVKAFVKDKAPMDFIGTGSWIRFAMFTADITHCHENGQWVNRAKVGRIHQDGMNHIVLFER